MMFARFMMTIWNNNYINNLNHGLKLVNNVDNSIKIDIISQVGYKEKGTQKIL